MTYTLKELPGFNPCIYQVRNWFLKPLLAKHYLYRYNAAGSRVKFLVDTPEKIWGSLEEREYLGGAVKLKSAVQVEVSCDP